MKKITILFAMLATLFVGTTVEVVAQTLEVTTDPANPVYYTIKNFRSENYATYMGANTQLAQRNGITKAALWYFEASGDGYKLVNAVDGMKQATHSSATTDGATWYLKENPYKAGYTCVSLNSGLDGNCWDDQGNNGSIGYWRPDEGTSWVTEKANTDDIQTALDDWSNGYTVNFSKAAGFTQNNRFTTFIKLGDQSITIPTKGQGTLAYRFISDQTFTATAGATIAPTIGYTGQWMHGFVFIDLNNDGSFTSDELVSYLNYDPNGPDGTGNALRSNNQTLPEFTLPTEAGTYRMRYMVDWQDNAANVNPGGVSDILSNRGVIYDVMLEVVSTKAALEAAIQSTTEEYNTLNNGATTVQIGYPTTAALEALQQAIADAQAVYDANEGGYDEAVEALAAALATAKSVENTNYTPRTDVYYTITSARGSMIYDPSHSADVDNIYGNEFLWYTTSLDNTNANHQWGFVEKDGKYYMYNVGKVQFANVTQGGSYEQSNGDKHTWMFSNSPSSVTLDAGEGNWVPTPNVRVRAHSEVTNKEYAMSISTSFTGPVIAYDAVNDGGIPMTFALATKTQDEDVTTAILALLEDLTPFANALQETIDKADAVEFGTKLGQYAENADFTAALNAAKDEYTKAATKETTKDALIQVREALENALAALELNMPQDGQFIRIKSVLADKAYLQAADASATMKFSTATDNSTIFCYYGGKLVAYQNGIAVNNIRDMGTVGGEATTFTFKVGLNGTQSTYSLYGGNNVLYSTGANGSNADWFNTGSLKDNTTFTLEEVTELPITLKAVGDKYYATFSAPVGVTAVNDADIYTVKVEGNQAKYTVYNGQVPAEKGLLLIGDAAEATITLGDVDAPTEFETDMKPQFECIAAATAKEQNKLFLGTNSGKLGFYNLKSETGKSGGFKAYIQNTASAPASGEAKGFELVADNEATGIDSIHNSLTIDNGDIYNLQGQKVNKAQKGVFIQNGKKVVVK